MNLTSFILYASDKAAAKKSQARIPERRLHLLAIFGGCFGAVAGQQIFRHKTKKVFFVLFTWLCCLMHVALLLFLLWDAI
jgi:uncharacterized membrane protein YsdA (DUF1294 family)